MDHSKIVKAMKELSIFRFMALWVWLIILSSAPALYAIAKIIEALK